MQQTTNDNDEEVCVSENNAAAWKGCYATLDSACNAATLPALKEEAYDAVHHPAHYVGSARGECIDYTKQMDFITGNCLKYAWRAGLKGDGRKGVEDCDKALWYLNAAWMEAEKCSFWGGLKLHFMRWMMKSAVRKVSELTATRAYTLRELTIKAIAHYWLDPFNREEFEIAEDYIVRLRRRVEVGTADKA